MDSITYDATKARDLEEGSRAIGEETHTVTANVRDRLRTQLFKELIPLPAADWPDDETDLFGLGLDSIRVIRLLVFIEEEFKVKIPDDAADPRSMATVSALIRLVNERGKG